MPLKNRKPIGLKKLKRIIGRKGPAFAQLVGIPVDTLKSIESGRMPLSRENGLKIRLATGADIPSLFHITPKAASHRGPYTADDFVWWRQEFLALQKDSARARSMAEQSGAALGFWSSVLLLAAVEKGKEISFRSLHLQLCSVLEDLAEKNGLTEIIAKELERFAEIDVSPKKRKIWWLSNDPGAVAMRSFYDVSSKDLRHIQDLDFFQTEKKQAPAWDPSTVPTTAIVYARKTLKNRRDEESIFEEKRKQVKTVSGAAS